MDPVEKKRMAQVLLQLASLAQNVAQTRPTWMEQMTGLVGKMNLTATSCDRKHLSELLDKVRMNAPTPEDLKGLTNPILLPTRGKLVRMSIQFFYNLYLLLETIRACGFDHRAFLDGTLLKKKDGPDMDDDDVVPDLLDWAAGRNDSSSVAPDP